MLLQTWPLQLVPLYRRLPAHPEPLGEWLQPRTMMMMVMMHCQWEWLRGQPGQWQAKFLLKWSLSQRWAWLGRQAVGDSARSAGGPAVRRPTAAGTGR